MRVKSSFISRTFWRTAREKILFVFLLLWSCLYVHKILMWAFSLFSSTLRDTQYFSLANAHTHTHKHYISKHVCFCSGYNCCTPSLSSIVFLCVCACWTVLLFPYVKNMYGFILWNLSIKQIICSLYLYVSLSAASFTLFYI